MNIEEYADCRFLRLCAISRPQGQLHLPTAIAAIEETFAFQIVPTDIVQSSSAGLEFFHGSFDDVGIDKLTVFPDGLLVQSGASTGLIQAFMDRFMRWMEEEFELQFVETHERHSLFESNIVFTSDRDPTAMGDRVVRLIELIESKVNETSKLDCRYTTYGFRLHTDTNVIPGLKPIPFTVERRLGSDFSQNRYFSTAPLRSPDHIEILEHLESIS